MAPENNFRQHDFEEDKKSHEGSPARWNNSLSQDTIWGLVVILQMSPQSIKIF